jgi:hypothetical protein
MSVRFRIRTSQGQEISFASHEMFAEFVRSGDLSPDDVVYDAETREWSSARTHPVVLQIELDSEDEAEAEASEVPDGDVEEIADLAPASDTSTTTADSGLDLAPAPDQMSPEQEAAEFVKKMEAERASSRQFDEDSSFGFTMEHGASGLLESMTPVPPQEEPQPTTPAPPPPPPRSHTARREEPRRAESWRDEPREAPSRKSSKAEAGGSKRKAGSGSGAKNVAIVVALVAAVGAGVVFGPRLFQAVEEGARSAGQDSVVLPPPPPPLIPDTEDALRARARERYLTTTRALLRDLPPIPDIWLRGAYLAAPSDYPQVREVWDRYLTTIRQVRAGDNERYRAGYNRALDDARVEGSARTLRLAAAMSDFQGAVGPRAAHYDRAEALALAAIQGHDALVQAEGTIAYEPAATTPVSGDPVIEAVGRNPEAQELLDEVLDVILAQLQAPDGPGRAANVGEWVWSGLLDAVAN